MAEPNSQNSVSKSTQVFELPKERQFTLASVRNVVIGIYSKIFNRLDNIQNPNLPKDGVINLGDLIDYIEEKREKESRQITADGRTFQYCRQVLRGLGSQEPNLDKGGECFAIIETDIEDYKKRIKDDLKLQAEYIKQGTLPKQFKIADLEAALGPAIAHAYQTFSQFERYGEERALDSVSLIQGQGFKILGHIEEAMKSVAKNNPISPLNQVGEKTKGNGPAR